jgi:6-phosphogluconolactonase
MKDMFLRQTPPVISRWQKKVLFEPLNINMEKVFAVDTMLPPQDAALQYMNALATHFKEEEPALDLILLGLG